MATLNLDEPSVPVPPKHPATIFEAPDVRGIPDDRLGRLEKKLNGVLYLLTQEGARRRRAAWARAVFAFMAAAWVAYAWWPDARDADWKKVSASVSDVGSAVLDRRFGQYASDAFAATQLGHLWDAALRAADPRRSARAQAAEQASVAPSGFPRPAPSRR